MREFDVARARISAALVGRGALSSVLSYRFDKLLGVIERVVLKHLNEFGSIIADKTRQKLLESSASGRTYTYVDAETKAILDIHTASPPNEPPASFTNLLFDSIGFKVHSYDGSVEVGVYVDTLHQYNTVGFILGEDIVLVGSGRGTPVSEYAYYLEHGASHIDKFTGKTVRMEPRPFLHPGLLEGVKEARKSFRKELSNEVKKIFKKKVPIYFRIHVKK